MFKQTAEKLAEKFVSADGETLQFGRTQVRFPQPIPHGKADSGLR